MHTPKQDRPMKIISPLVLSSVLRNTHTVPEVVDVFNRCGVDVSKRSVVRWSSNKPQKGVKKKQGRPGWWSVDREKQLVSEMKSIQGGRELQKECTAALLKKRLKIPLSESTIRRKLNSLGYFFRRPMSYAQLEPSDIRERLDFASAHVGRQSRFWESGTLFIDSKKFRIGNTPAARRHNAACAVRGVWRKVGEPRVHSRPRKGDLCKYPGVNIMGGVMGGKVVLWEAHTKFTSAVLQQMIAKCQKKCEKAGHPIRRIVLDQHVCHTSKETRAFFKRVGLQALYVPKRSPDLSLMDYSVWSDVESRMRATPIVGSISASNWQDLLAKQAKKVKASCVLKERLLRVIESGGYRFSENQ